MLAAISIVTGLIAGILFLVQAQRAPADKAKQMRILAGFFFSLAVVMALVFWL